MVLTELLANDVVPFEVLHQRYGALLRLVEKMIGVVPNCDPYLEIYPPAFRAYNVMVPNLINLPFLVWGLGTSRSAIGLAMYVSSRASGCMYCSAHSCSFALRRGATVDEVASALNDDPKLGTAERAVVSVARSLGKVPSEISKAQRTELEFQFGQEHAEWVVLSIAMMGWLNKTMDALGVPLEESTAEEVTGVISASGWTPGQHLQMVPKVGQPPRKDSFATKLSVVRYAPSAIALDKRWTSGVPAQWPAVGEFLRQATGHDFPILSQLRHRRAVRAIATMIRDTFAEGVLPRAAKLSAGLVFADAVANPRLAGDLRAAGAASPDGDSPVIRLAAGIASSPANVDDVSMDAARQLAPAGIVELVSFFALLQMLHRLDCYYAAT